MTGSDNVFRIAAFSGYTGDRFDALQRQAESSGCQVLFGDYLAEMNLAWRALEIKENPELGYERPFLAHLTAAAKAIAANKCKVVTNAGALNPKGCAEAVVKILKSQGIELKVAYVLGDNIINRLDELAAAGEKFTHLESDSKHLTGWNLEPLTANAYVGARGVRAALEAGADIVISGRCTDASPVIAAAAWWHKWDWDNYDALAGALLAGHCIECGAYVTGGNSSGFKRIKNYYNFTMGIAEIQANGEFVITKQPNSNGFNGIVDDITVRSQILYEIQGNVYLNPDVQGIIDDITVTNVGEDRVSVTGVRGIAPPDTTKAAICAVAGWQAETHIFATGLDVTEKFEAAREQIRQYLGDNIKKFTTLDMTQYGVAQVDPQNEALGTATLRIFAQAKDLEAFGPTKGLLGMVNPEGLGHYPGYHSSMDMRTLQAKPYIEYWPGRVSQAHLPLQVQFVGSDKVIDVPCVANTQPVQKSADYDAKVPLKAGEYGPTKRCPIGTVVHARSGDKGGNANVGFFVRSPDEYPWLKSLLTKAELQRMLGGDWEDNRLERVEFPGMLAVHFVVHDYLGGGVSSTPKLDCLAKGVAEYLRSKFVDVPEKFIARGEI